MCELNPMYDPRYDNLADVLVNHSTRVARDESVLIESTDVPDALVIAIVRAVRQAGGIPLVSLKSSQIHRELIRQADRETMQRIGEYEAHRMKHVQVHIGVHGDRNMAEMSDVSSEKMHLYRTYWMMPVHFEIRMPHTRWICLRWPSPAMAQQANLSTEAFEDFYFKVCALDYGKMKAAAVSLKKLMETTDKVHIVSPDTDLTFSIKEVGSVSCTGEKNLPDGECYSAPLRESVNGYVRFNVPVNYQGTTLKDIRLHFKDGRVVECSGDNKKELEQILSADEGARYLGEFAVAFNPYITAPMLNTVFDEKIAGSFHLALGKAYEDADNGNRSAIHLDMVMIQTPEYGGGQIFFDDMLLRKDGIFVLPECEGLNPKNLL